MSTYTSRYAHSCMHETAPCRSAPIYLLIRTHERHPLCTLQSGGSSALNILERRRIGWQPCKHACDASDAACARCTYFYVCNQWAGAVFGCGNMCWLGSMLLYLLLWGNTRLEDVISNLIETVMGSAFALARRVMFAS